MRLNYSDDEDYPGQFNLWQGNVNRQLQGKRGQAALREVEAALLALPEKRLVDHAVARDGAVCAVGAYILKRRLEAGEDRATVLTDLEQYEDCDDTPELGERFGLPSLVAWKLVCLNDVEIDYHVELAQGPGRHPGERAGYSAYVDYTPEERYEQVLAWVRSNIKDTSSSP